VKTYVAGPRNHVAFGTGVECLLKNSASTGGRSILARQLTTGELFSYMVYMGVMTVPLIQISNISMKIPKTFARLDRIHELRSVPKKDAEDDERKSTTDGGRRRLQ
jgi:ABC-type bacteriocin/lantibiotic exporter with double-glycine peptidase domain